VRKMLDSRQTHSGMTGANSQGACPRIRAEAKIQKFEGRFWLVYSLIARGYVVNETNPFAVKPPTLPFSRRQSPYVLRMRLMWAAMKGDVIERFPPEPGIVDNIERCMTNIEEKYRTDAYHSLSIEGYRVTNEMIKKVATGTFIRTSMVMGGWVAS
ncbi:MAG: hypothetical protein U9R69_05845, partial [Thermodesulfobacteriota bacterium]|nr:hypothetical protein [Thermodesulfobacteriota bacterium]